MSCRARVRLLSVVSQAPECAAGYSASRILLHRAKTRWLTRPGLQSPRAFSFVHCLDEDRRPARDVVMHRVLPRVPGIRAHRVFGPGYAHRSGRARGDGRLCLVLELSRLRRGGVRRSVLDDQAGTLRQRRVSEWRGESGSHAQSTINAYTLSKRASSVSAAVLRDPRILALVRRTNR